MSLKNTGLGDFYKDMVLKHGGDVKSVRRASKKLGEEAVELVIDAVRLADDPASEKARRRVVDESADLLHHYLTLLACFEITPDEVMDTLKKRHK